MHTINFAFETLGSERKTGTHFKGTRHGEILSDAQRYLLESTH